MFYRIIYSLVYGVFALMNHGTRAEGLERLPAGGCILCPNHTCLTDPIHVAFSLGRHERPRFMAKAELFRSRLFAAVLRGLGAFPVKRGQADLASIRESLKILSDGGRLLIFPEGTRVKEGESADAKAGAAFLASRAGVPLVPVYIENSAKLFSRVRVVYGEPVLPEGRKPDLVELSDRVMAGIEALRRG